MVLTLAHVQKSLPQCHAPYTEIGVGGGAAMGFANVAARTTTTRRMRVCCFGTVLLSICSVGIILPSLRARLRTNAADNFTQLHLGERPTILYGRVVLRPILTQTNVVRGIIDVAKDARTRNRFGRRSCCSRAGPASAAP